MNAIQIADSFDSFAIDHTPDGWPAVQQKQLTEAALMLRKQHEAIRVLLEACQIASASLPDVGRVQKALKTALADAEDLI